MHIVLWDTRQLDASKDFAGGMGVGMYPGHGGIRGKLIRRFYTRDHRPTALVFAHLAAGFRRLGHRVEYVEDRPPAKADLYLFCPSLATLALERQVVADLLKREPAAQVLVIGLAASVVPNAFDDLPVTVVKGEAEQLCWKLDEVLARPGTIVNLGVIEDLDSLPLPDWSSFGPSRFRIGYDFSQFPTALIQSSRGCSFKCNYCPYIIVENAVRRRDPEGVIEEIQRDVYNWGFRSFKFRDPLFGINRDDVYRLADLLGRLHRPIQFSIETRIELVPPEVLRVLRRVGLTSITVGLETLDNATLKRYHRAPVTGDRQAEFVDTCRTLGIRTVAGFMIGFPDDTEESIRNVLDYAQQVNPTFANFNIVTPYPGTQFFDEIKERIADFDFSQYTVYTPVLKYTNLSAQQVRDLHAKCFNRFYFRWKWLRDNATVLWPWLTRLGVGGRAPQAEAETAHPAVPEPAGMRGALERRGLRSDRPHQLRREG
jgi:radical SAM superfamily enzyme YgiQ (UPF0313 family)